MSTRKKRNTQASKQIAKKVEKQIEKRVDQESNRQPRRRTRVVQNYAGMSRVGGKHQVGSNLARQMVSGMTKGVGATLREEQSTRDFPKVYMNPFLTLDARLPVWPVRSTLCQFRRATSLGKTNSDGNGWIVFSPMNMICNDVAFAAFSNEPSSANTINGVGPEGYTTAGGAYAVSNFYGSDSFSVRLVAFGFKLRYIGTKLNEGGYVTFNQMCPRATMDGMTSTDIQSKYIEWKQAKFDSNWKQFNRLYTENDDALYMNKREDTDPQYQWAYDDFVDANTENHAYIGAYINGAAANQPFEVMSAGHFELIGPLNNTTGVATTTLNSTKHEQIVSKAAKLRTVDNTMKPSGFWEKVGHLAGGLDLAGVFL